MGHPTDLGDLPASPGGAQLVACLAVILVSVGICTRAARLLGGKDPQSIVLDEIAALPLVFLTTGIPQGRVLLAGWLLFRLFDILKPPPARQYERFPAGWGIVADDVVAAIYAGFVLGALVWLDTTLQWGLITVLSDVAAR